MMHNSSILLSFKINTSIFKVCFKCTSEFEYIYIYIYIYTYKVYGTNILLSLKKIHQFENSISDPYLYSSEFEHKIHKFRKSTSGPLEFENKHIN